MWFGGELQQGQSGQPQAHIIKRALVRVILQPVPVKQKLYESQIIDNKISHHAEQMEAGVRPE